MQPHAAIGASQTSERDSRATYQQWKEIDIAIDVAVVMDGWMDGWRRKDVDEVDQQLTAAAAAAAAAAGLGSGVVQQM